MGVPAFFRWLSRKYPSIVVHSVEEKAQVDADGKRIQPDCTKPNPNDVEFDNLYLDMNGIIHPCCHPEDKPAPKNEDEMMVAIFEYIDRIFAICRPRKLLYMAIDGVAPRAKMNQQRSRRFRASKESETKRDELAKIRAQLEANGCTLPPEKPKGEHFDSNCITPGTPFMFRLAECLRYYIHERLNTDPAWKNIKIILSDANMPGEGEHKIMDYIRKQRVGDGPTVGMPSLPTDAVYDHLYGCVESSQPDHDPNTHHCLCGADADLIMLGLATHEPNFTIIREEFKPGKPRPCEICGQIGHEAKECTGAAKEKSGEHDELETIAPSEVEFIFIRLNVLREYLSRDLVLTGINFKYDFERVLDDWIFMCFFVGNDFLPHLPSLEIREGAIDRLVRIYKETVRQTGGYLATAGEVNLTRVQVVLQALGEAEDQIFKNRRQDEMRFRERKKNERKRTKMQQDQWSGAQRPSFMGGGQQPYKPGQGQDQKYTKEGAAAMRNSNMEAAAGLRAMLYKDGEKPSTSKPEAGQKRKHEDSDSEPEPEDDVKLWEDGWKSRYYENKFGVDKDDHQFRHTVAKAYAIGLCWVLRYYFQGCASWKWYFPYHYAPFASDFVNIGDLPNDFEKGTQPFQPFEQLMAVFPAASQAHLPPTWRPLMYEPDSPIIDFYPTDFRIDLNGKKWAWMGVALLPFVDEKRLLSALKPRYADLTEEEKSRAVKGSDRLFVSKWHPSYDFFINMYKEQQDDEPMTLVTKLTDGMLGIVRKDPYASLANETVPSPVPQFCDDIQDNKAIMVKYQDPEYEEGHIYPAIMLPGAKLSGSFLKSRKAAVSWQPALRRAFPLLSAPSVVNHPWDRSRALTDINHNSVLGPPVQQLRSGYGQKQEARDQGRSHSHGRPILRGNSQYYGRPEESGPPYHVGRGVQPYQRGGYPYQGEYFAGGNPLYHQGGQVARGNFQYDGREASQYHDGPVVRAVSQYRDGPSVRGVTQYRDGPVFRGVSQYYDGPIIRRISPHHSSHMQGPVSKYQCRPDSQRFSSSGSTTVRRGVSPYQGEPFVRGISPYEGQPMRRNAYY